MRALPAFAAALLTVSLALAGCSAGGSDSGDMKADSQAGPARGGQGAAAPEAAADKGSEQLAEKGTEAGADSATTHVIRTASLSVEVKSVTKALATARSVALGAGGEIEDETTERIDDTHVTSKVVLRVPEAEYDSVLKELAGTGKLLARTANAKDVTEQVVDVKSRIATQRASVTRVRDLMDQAEDITDVVALETQLNNRQAELESLLARQASLADRTTMATVTLDLSEETKEKEEGDDDPGFLDALGGGWDAFVSMLRWTVVVLAAILPFAAALAVLYVLWRLFGVRLLGLGARRTPVATPAPAPEPAAAPAPDPAPAPAQSPDAGKQD
ncbi:DUF4349 domain-containing protein [Streptomyces sp. NPDC051217]|uniref:DUF4349 domain-containing protein n=1 Tax=Streptomyces sp. NPDC051217 TaxID=3365644 RepID=UPI0037939A8F